MSEHVASSNIEASKVTGTRVYNRTGDNLGSIHDVVIGKRDGQVKYAIMSFGGFLGLGEEYHPLPWEKLDYDERMGGYVVDLDKEQLHGAPRFGRESAPDWNDREYGRRVDDYYGVGTSVPGRY